MYDEHRPASIERLLDTVSGGLGSICMTVRKRPVTNDGVSSCLDLFTPEECTIIVDSAIRHYDRNPGYAHTHQEASRTPLRRCAEYCIDPHSITLPDGSSVAFRVYEAFSLGNIWNLEYSEVPSIRVMEYFGGDGYGAHTDWSNGAARHRKVSMTVQLTNPDFYEGGEVRLYAGPEHIDISRQRGAATLWPAWTLHEVKPVTQGARYSLTAWAHGEEFR